MDNRPTLPNIVEKLLDLKAAKDRLLHDVPNHLLPGAEMVKHNAAQEFEELRAVLRGGLPALSAAIFVRGPGAAAFADIAVDEELGLTIDASTMYREIAKEWYPTTEGVGVKHFAIDSIPTFLGGLNKVVYPMGVRTIAPPDFNPIFNRKVETFEDAVDVTRDLLRATVGDELSALYIVSLLTDKVLDECWTAPVAPVILTNTTEEEAKGELFERLFNGRNILLNAPENVDKNAVTIAFKHLREKLPRQHKQSNNQQPANNPKE